MQRRFAISRDLYDIHQLVQTGISLAEVARLLPNKFDARGLDINDLTIEKVRERRNELENDWNNRLSYLVRQEQKVSFSTAWDTVLATIQQVINHLGKPNSSTR